MTDLIRRLILAPHADDEVLGCGGLLAKYHDVSVAVVASPTVRRLGELHQALDALGHCSEVHYGSFDDGYVGMDTRLLQTWVDEVVAQVEPHELYIPAPGVHQDHVAVYEAGVRAARLSMQPSKWVPNRVLAYDVVAYDVHLYSVPWQWNVIEQLSEGQAGAKAAAMMCYASQSPPGRVASELLGHARALGSAYGVGYAERYALIREVRK